MSDADDPRKRGEHAGDALAEHRVGGEQVYAGVLLDVRRDRARMPDGGIAVREYIVHPGAVLIVPVRDDGSMIVERQYRYPHDRAFLEFPAGKLDAGESALASGVRELIEETGYRASIWIRLGVVHPVISYSTEAIELYLARRLAPVGARLDPEEFLEVLERTEAQLYEAIDEGRLTDAKTIAALAIYSRWSRAPSRSICLRITGRVQGVGYRDWVVRRANGLTGWVRNRADGSVEAHAQGSGIDCDRFIEGCAEGPRGARVERVVVEQSPLDATLEDFDMRRTE